MYTELSFIRSVAPTDAPTLIRAREFSVRYDVDSHAPSKSLFLTSNAGGKVNRELLVASLDAPDRWSSVASQSTPVLPHSDTRSLDGVSVFDSFVAVSGREGGFTQLWVVPLGTDATASDSAHRLSFPEESFTANLGSNDLFESDGTAKFEPALLPLLGSKRLFTRARTRLTRRSFPPPPPGKLRVSYSSMVTPRSVLEFDVPAKTYETLKVTPVPKYDPSLYQTRRLEVTARDGAKVPVTLLWRPDAMSSAQPDGVTDDFGGGAPCHLYGYGSYGICMDPSFSATRLALVDRGVVFAVAHIRGGGEMGHHAWYEAAGKYLEKRNTFFDFVDCANHLVASGVAQSDRLSCEGRSAGGLLVGNVVNDAPELFCAAVAGVPFVDLMTTMCDPSIPLTTEEWEEWGNPNEAKYHSYMQSYSPIDNVVEGATYPKMLIVSGLNDPRVAYWEPTKWAQVLRARVANGEDVLLKMDLAAGHFSAADRYKYLRELSFDYAWLLEQLGRAD